MDHKTSQSQMEQLKLLLAYTQWHIGLYITSIAGLATLTGFAAPKASSVTKICLCFSILFLILAGITGSITAKGLIDIDNRNGFWEEGGDSLPLGHRNIIFVIDKWPWGSEQPFRKKTTISDWTHWEHLFFWLAIFVAFIGFLIYASQNLYTVEALTPAKGR